MKLVSCVKCGFVYYDGDYEDSDLELFYQKHYYINSYQLRAEHPAEKEYNEKSIDILLANGVCLNATVVDVGCGPGHLLNQMRVRGFNDLAGVELSNDYVKELEQNGFSAYHSSSIKLPIPENIQVDCFIYKNIFEHLFSLHETVSEIRQKIAIGGTVFVEVPDAAIYDHCKQYHPLHYFTLEHINHFDRAHLQNLFVEYGFKLIDNGTRMLDIAEKYPIPIMYCMFRYTGEPEGSKVPDFQLAEKSTYWLESGAAFEKPELQKLRMSGKSVYVWGLSYRTLMQCAMSPLKDCSIKYFVDIDSRKQGLTINGNIVVSPDVLQNASSDEAVVIGVGPSSSKMQQTLVDMGFVGEIIVLD
jgi:SAM-dependent methyltransferase